jgi:hypothetical protein
MSEESKEQEIARFERNRKNPPKPSELKTEYVKHYRRGRAASLRDSVAALDAADMRGEPEAWYHGYYDAACGDQMWTRVPESAWKPVYFMPEIFRRP